MEYELIRGISVRASTDMRDQHSYLGQRDNSRRSQHDNAAPARQRASSNSLVRLVFRRITATVAAVAVTGAVAVLSSATAYAGMDSQKRVVDRSGHTLSIEQWDINLQGVSPMDQNRLTREWFHSGRAVFAVAGDGADAFSGTLEFGYQIGFPWSDAVTVNFTYTTPNVYAWDAPAWAPQRSLITPNLFPGVSISSDIGNGPGIQEVVTFSVPISGTGGEVAVANAHGTVTGAVGGVELRPFARLIWPNQATVTTYGDLWNMN